MNLELLDPFRRQIPDRVDSTLSLPTSLHPAQVAQQPPKKDPPPADVVNDNDSEKASISSSTAGATPKHALAISPTPEIDAAAAAEEMDHHDQEWKAAYHVAFNRRGTYLAVGHAKGTVAVHDFLSRTLSALYRPPEEEDPPLTFPNGVTSVTWSRRSRTLLAGAVGDAHVRLMDTTHPMGPEDCCPAPEDLVDLVDHPSDNKEISSSPTASAAAPAAVAAATLSPNETHEMVRRPRRLEIKEIPIITSSLQRTDPTVLTMQERHEAALRKMRQQESERPPNKSSKKKRSRTKRFATLLWTFPEPVGGSLQVHPRVTTGGLAVLQSGSLVLFRAPPTAWESYPLLETKPVVKIAALYHGEQHQVTCAAFDTYGSRVYAATKDGKLLGWNVSRLFTDLASAANAVEPTAPAFEIAVPGNATAWHLIVSRNGRFLLLNCADGMLRLYNMADCWDSSNDTKPTFVFQDVVSKTQFASCDFSGDAEYVVAGCNTGSDDKYELYLWNTSTGALMDRLTGAQVSLYSVTWHPTRSFLAVGTSDGLVDIWGPRMDWTAFAPDFQALPMNVEYVEREDEFDIVDKGPEDSSSTEDQMEENDEKVDVVTVDPVPVFASDSEEETEVFQFETKIKNIMAGRGRNSLGWSGKTAADEKE